VLVVPAMGLPIARGPGRHGGLVVARMAVEARFCRCARPAADAGGHHMVWRLLRSMRADPPPVLLTVRWQSSLRTGVPSFAGESHLWFAITSDNDDACGRRSPP